MRITLDIPISLKKIKNALSTPASEVDENIIIEHISTDTRELLCGDLFFALPGENFDGEDFVEEAAARGAFTVSKRSSIADIRVKDCLSALSDLAGEYKKLLPLKYTVAITGSVGKTTTKELLYQLIRVSSKVHATRGNLNNLIGVPLTLLTAPRDTEFLIIEAGMNHKGELKEISRSVKPDICIITKIGSSHIGNLGSRRAIAAAKLEITEFMNPTSGKVIIPYGEPLIPHRLGTKTVSVSSKESDFSFIQNPDSSFSLLSEKFKISSLKPRTEGSHTGECLAFALAAYEELGFTEEELRLAIKSLRPTENAAKIYRATKFTLIDDSYNSSPESIEAALKTLKRADGNLISVCIGDVLELGSHTKRIHRKIGELCCQYKVNKIYTFGRFSDYISEGAVKSGFPEEKIFKNKDLTRPEVTAKQIYSTLSEGEVILFKASHKLNLSRIVRIILSYPQ